MDDFKPYIRDGLIGQRDGDFGDGLYRNALYSVLTNDKAHWELTKKHCEVSPGIWVRHPDPTRWYSSPTNCSRDQVAKAMLAAAYFKDTSTIKRWIKEQAKRGFWHQNNRVFNDTTKWKVPDIMAPNEWANIIRGLNIKILYPILMFLDLFLLGDLYFRKKNTWDYDSLLAINIWYANEVMSNPISKLCVYLYKKTDYNDRILYNFCRTENDICPLGNMYVDFLKERL